MRAPDAEFDTPAFLDLLRKGDDAAYRRLIRRYHGSLVGVASAIIGSRAQAEEVVQDAWLAVFSGIGRFEGRSSLASWIFTIVMNRARTRIGREGRLVALPAGRDGSEGEERAVPLSAFQADGHWVDRPVLWDELDPERVVRGRQLWAHAMEAIEKLPQGQKAVIILRDIEGQSAEDACSLLSISPENQRVLLHRARGRVRAVLDELMRPTAARAGSAPAKEGARRLGVDMFTGHALHQFGRWLVRQGFRGRAVAQRLQRLVHGADRGEEGLVALQGDAHA